MNAIYKILAIQEASSDLARFLPTLLVLSAVAVAIWLITKRTSNAKAKTGNSYINALKLIIDGRHEEAVKELTTAAGEDNDNLDAFIRLGSLHRHLDKPRKAAQIHLELTARAKLTKVEKATIFRELALDYEQADLLDNAHKQIEEALKIDPSNQQSQEIKLELMERQERWGEAAGILERQIKKSGNGSINRLALYRIREGETLCLDGEEESGRISFKDAIRIDPSLVEAQLFIAESLKREKRFDEALEWISKFIKENPAHGELAMPLLEELLYETDRFEEIEPIIRDTVDKAPENRLMAITLIDLLSKKGEIDEALRLCDQRLDSAQSDLITKVYRLQLLRRKGEKKSADRELDELLALIAPYGRGFYCRVCGQHSGRLMSRCPSCGQWRSFFGERRRVMQSKSV